jgi:hypothetical protein
VATVVDRFALRPGHADEKRRRAVRRRVRAVSERRLFPRVRLDRADSIARTVAACAAQTLGAFGPAAVSAPSLAAMFAGRRA